MCDDRELLRQYAETHSQEAFARFVERHLRLVYAAALRRTGGQRHLAEDVAQQVFCEVARRCSTLADHPMLIGWLYSCTRFAALRLLRTERRRQARESAVAVLHAADNSPAAPPPGQLQTIIDEAMDGLSAADRAAVLLRFFDERSWAEIGAHLHLSEDGARLRVGRALERLRRILARQGVRSTAAGLSAALAEHTAAATVPAGLAGTISGTATTLAASAGASAGTWSAIQLMTSAKFTFLAAGIIGAGAIGLALRTAREIASDQASLANARGGLQHLASPGLSPGNTAIRETGVPGAAQSIPAPPPEMAAPSPKAEPGTGQSQQEDFKKFLSAVPPAREILLAKARQTAAVAYGPFFRSAGMSPAEIAQFTDICAHATLDQLVLTSAGFSGDPGIMHPPEAQLRAFLGDERYQQFADFLQIQAAYSYTSLAAAPAGLAGVPLSADQKDQVVQVIAKNLSRAPSGGLLDFTAVNWTAAVPQIQALVSPAQWTAVQGPFLRVQLREALRAAGDRSVIPRGK